MNDNPYQAPSTQEPIERRSAVARRGEQSFNSLWDTFFWTFMGFAGGTLLAQVVMVAALRHRIIGGMIYGGVPLALLAFVVVERRRRARTAPQSKDSFLSEDSKARD